MQGNNDAKNDNAGKMKTTRISLSVAGETLPPPPQLNKRDDRTLPRAVGSQPPFGTYIIFEKKQFEELMRKGIENGFSCECCGAKAVSSCVIEEGIAPIVKCTCSSGHEYTVSSPERAGSKLSSRCKANLDLYIAMTLAAPAAWHVSQTLELFGLKVPTFKSYDDVTAALEKVVREIWDEEMEDQLKILNNMVC
tara:strand:- start:1889 stop:2470 length:582 start_codon:yes stop_codon:yes gene_type:complete